MFSKENLLDVENYIWNQIRDEPPPRNLKRVRYFDGSPSEPATECDDGAKRRNMFDDTLADVSKEGPSTSTIKACDQSQNLQKVGDMSGRNHFGARFSEVIPEGDREAVSSDEQKALLHSSLQLEMTRLCQVLKFSDAVTDVALRFLEYVINNRDMNSREQSIMQALQISLCWIAASITKTKIDKKDSLMLAKLLLNYWCTEEQAHSVYIILKEMYSQCPEKIVDSGRYCSLDEEGTPKEKAALNKNVKKRMKRLAQKHQEQRQELMRNWEEERVKLVTDHNVVSSFVQSIHGQSSVGIDKIKVLENDLDVKVSELNLRKGVELKNLEARQLADIAEEERKIAQWQAEAKAPETVNVLESLGPQPKEQVVEGSQPSETHVENSVTVSSQNELKGSSNDEVAILANPPGFVELVPDEIEINRSEKVSDKGCKSASPNEVISNVDLHCPKLPSLHYEQAPDRCDLSPPKGLDELAVEKPSTLQAEAEAVDNICPVPSVHEAPVTEEAITPGLSNNEALVTEKTVTLVQSINDKTITSVPSNREVPVTENSRLLSCNTSPATNENGRGRSSPQTAEYWVTEVLSHASTHRSSENLYVHINQPNNTEPVSSAAQGQSAELSAPSRNDVTTQSQVMMSAAERANQVVLQPGIDPSFLLLPSYQPNFGSLHPSLLADPFKNELDNLRKEAEQLENNQNNLISQVSSERDKEIQEAIAQIRKKYGLKFQENDTEYQLKKQELDKYLKKLLMNKMLAMVFRSTCSYPEEAGLTVMEKVAPSSSVQPTHQVSAMPSVGPSPGLSPSQPAPTYPVATQSLPTMQPNHLSRAHPITRSPTLINQSIPTSEPTPRLSPSQPGTTHPVSAQSLPTMQRHHLSQAHPITRSPTLINQSIPTGPPPGLSPSQPGPTHPVSAQSLPPMQRHHPLWTHPFIRSPTLINQSIPTGPPPGLSPSQPGPTHPVSAQSVPTMRPNHLSRAHPVTRSPTLTNQSIPTVGPSPSQPGPTHPVSAQSLPTMQPHHLSRAHPTFINQSIPTVPSPTFASQSIPAVRSSTAVQNTAALFSSTTPHRRPPPLISTITPSCNPRPGGEFRSAAPHLQSSRPPVATSAPAPAPHLRAPHGLHSHDLPLSASTTNRAGALPQGLPNNSRAYVPATENHLSSDIRSTFGSVEPSDLGTQGDDNVPGNVVCLSDDD